MSKIILDAAIEVHRTLGGPGLLETIYEAALCQELSLRGLSISRQVSIPVVYKQVVIKDPLVLDIVVEEKVIIEVKSVEKENPVYFSQLLTYLRLTNLKLGLLINFGQDRVADNVKRVVNGL